MKKIFILLLLTAGFCLIPDSAFAAILYSQTANQDVYEGQSFTVDWFLDTESKPVNSFDLKVNFSKDLLEAVEANTGNTLVNLWIKYPTINNETGSIELTGGIANGINDSRVPIFRSVFKVKKSGTASITVDTASQILLNDGRGTEEQLKSRDVLFNIYPKEFIPITINSASHPDQNIWYSNKNVQINFNPKPGTDYSYSFSSNIDLFPEDKKLDVPNFFTYSDLPDGIYYFKLNSKVGPSTWQEDGVFRIQIDTTPPQSFEPLIAFDPSVFGGKSFVSFSTVDKTSGISHYKAKVGLFGKSVETQSPLQLQKPIIGDKIVITAYDVAGNSRTQTIEWRGYISVFEFKLILVLIGLAAVIVNWIVRKKLSKKK